MLERHRRRGVTRRRLRLRDVLGGIVNIRQHRRAETPGLDILIEGDVALDARTHPPHLRIAERLLSAEDEIPRLTLGQIIEYSRRQVDVPAAGFRFRRLDFRLVARRVRDRAFDMNHIALPRLALSRFSRTRRTVWMPIPDMPHLTMTATRYIPITEK